MADTVTPSSGNPYLALLQQEAQPPGWAQVLQHIGNLGFGLAGGFGQAAATGQPTMAAIGPGLMMGNQMNAQTAHQAEQERMKRLEWQFKAQEHEDKRAEMLRKEKQLQLMAGLYGPNGAPPGFNATPQQGPLMGPTPQGPTTTQPGPDLKTGGAPLADYLVAQHGLSPLAASTVVGNLYQESGFNPSATGDSGSAFGMAQWRLDRQTGLRNFAAAQNKPVTDPQVQLDYLVSEMKGGDMGAQRAWAGLQQAKTPEQANAAIMHFFRPQGYTPANPTGGHGYGQRVANTRALLPQSRPGDPTTAPVPGLPNPDEAPPASAPGPAPRPGLGPRATPQPPPAPEGVPVAQGGGEGEEVVLPRIGLPFPAPVRAPAPPGSVPFPTTAPAPAAPAGPAQTTQGLIMPPPVPKLPDRPTLTQADSVRLQSLVLGGHPEQAMAEYNRLLQMQRAEVMDRHKTEVEVWKQQQEGGRFERGEKAKRDAEERAQARQLEAEQRRAEGEQQRHERDVAERQKAREDAAKQAGDKLSFEQTKAMRDSEDKMRDDMNGIKQVQDFRKADLVFQSAQKAAKTNTAAADLNLVYAFATMMDPGSVVRDQETGMVIATQDASARIKALVATVSGGSRMQPDAKAALIAEMGSRHSAYKESHDAFATAFEDMARRRGLDPANVVTRVVVEKPKEGDDPNEPPLYDKNGKRITKP